MLRWGAISEKNVQTPKTSLWTQEFCQRKCSVKKSLDREKWTTSLSVTHMADLPLTRGICRRSPRLARSKESEAIVMRLRCLLCQKSGEDNLRLSKQVWVGRANHGRQNFAMIKRDFIYKLKQTFNRLCEALGPAEQPARGCGRAGASELKFWSQDWILSIHSLRNYYNLVIRGLKGGHSGDFIIYLIKCVS